MTLDHGLAALAWPGRAETPTAAELQRCWGMATIRYKMGHLVSWGSRQKTDDKAR